MVRIPRRVHKVREGWWSGQFQLLCLCRMVGGLVQGKDGARSGVVGRFVPPVHTGLVDLIKLAGSHVDYSN